MDGDKVFSRHAKAAIGLASMANPKLKIKATIAQDICDQFPLSAEAKPYLAPEIAPLDFLDLLVVHSLYFDAMQFLARALPKREAVWWSCTCARALPEDGRRPELAAGLQAAESWVYRPTEENRRKAEKAANAIKGSHPARWSAMAAFWSGGSLAAPDAPEVKPAEDFTAKAVAGAVMMAAGLDALEREARSRRFIECGLDIANGGTGRPPAQS
ncbi:MAG TPA: hypothetical protein VMA53_00435 [Stellaceae bacterium]|nr:hypothetical protein [Stellaceae bacterium]